MAEAISITLYHAGRSTNSLRALDRLARLIREFRVLPEAAEFVDVFVDRRRALDDRVMMTPALRIAFDGEVAWFFGDLTDDEQLVGILKRVEEAGS